MRGLDGKIGRQALVYSIKRQNLAALCSCYGRWKVDAIFGLGDERFADDGNGFRQTLPAHGFPGFGKEWSAILLAGVLPHPQRSESKNATICNTISRGIAGRGGKRRFEAVEADGTDFSLALVVWHIGSGKSYTATYIDK